MQIPVYATKRLVGAAGNGLFCGDCIVAPVQIIDGTSSGYLDPQQWINTDDAEPAAGFPTLSPPSIRSQDSHDHGLRVQPLRGR